ncbi:Protein LONGIFOLIA 2 [Linum perenne]
MAAKLLHSLADDNSDLQKHIGCMTGLFQIFDRQQMISSRRPSQRKFPSGQSHLLRGSTDRESFNGYHRHPPFDTVLNKSLNEKQRVSTESSRASFSSSCSSFSSLDNRTAQPEASSTDRTVFPMTPSRDSGLSQPSTCSYSERHSVDLRDVVKDSMYRDARGPLSVKTRPKEDTKGSDLQKQHKDSPRPFQLSKPANGNIKVKKNLQVDPHESLRVLSKIREAPWQHHNEAREHARPSHESSRDIWSTITKDSPRLSYDGRDSNRLSFESRDTIKSSPKVKELPRLSLDSRESSMKKASVSDSKRSSNLSRTMECSNESDLIRPPSVVAKLMGLDALPHSASAGDQSDLVKTSIDDRIGTDSFSRSFKQNDANVTIRIPKSPRSLVKNPDLAMKPVPQSPIEQAPWKQQPAGTRKSSFKVAKVPVKPQNSFPSVYSEIEKRLKDLEFKRSGKDLRALKQILEAMQAKGLLETGKEEQDSKFGTQAQFDQNLNQRPRFPRQQNIHENLATTSTTRRFESPIVIMKPAKLVEKSGIPSSSVIRIDGLPSLHRIQNGGNKQLFKDQSPRSTQREAVSNSGVKKPSGKSIRTTQASSKPSARESTGSVSPRLHQKRADMERRSRPPTPPPPIDTTSRPRRHSSTESTSPGGGKYRMKCRKQTQNDEQMSQISNESRTSGYQGDDIEVTSAERSAESRSPPIKATTNYLVPAPMQCVCKETSNFEELSASELVSIAPEQPSPVSVLDHSVYKEDDISPVKQIPNMPEVVSLHSQDDSEWNSSESVSNSADSGHAPDIDSKKLKNIEDLVQKLRRLNSTHDEASTDYIASLCDNKKPDHRYISEILLASGLLLRDLGSGLTTFQLHTSGHPINPQLFCVLEQTKARTLHTKEEKSLPSKTFNAEKFHRKLIFDAVNEILVKKLATIGVSPEPRLMMCSGKLARKTITAQRLLKELCSEIEQQLQVENLRCSSLLEEEDEEDGLKVILCEDVTRRSESWTEFDNEVSGLVLDVERLVFKDLVDEIVMGEEAGAGSRGKLGRRRKLFAK